MGLRGPGAHSLKAKMGPGEARPPQGKVLSLDLNLTAKEAAELAGVSDKLIHMLRAVQKRRPDLAEAAAAGHMSVNEAYCMATGRDTNKQTSWDRLVKAWNSATDEDREKFVAELGLVENSDN